MTESVRKKTVKQSASHFLIRNTTITVWKIPKHFANSSSPLMRIIRNFFPTLLKRVLHFTVL